MASTQHGRLSDRPDAARSVVSSQISSGDSEAFAEDAAHHSSAAKDGAHTGFRQLSSSPITPRSRHGFSNRRGNALAGMGSSTTNTSRPQSAVSGRSMPQSHTMASQAFFRPMSSQRLQAQRGARPLHGTNESIPDVPRLSTSTANRPSLESSSAAPQGQTSPLPPSRGTDFTEQAAEDRVYYNSSPTGGNTIRTGDSSQPLNVVAASLQERPDTSSRIPRTPNTPQSFTSNFARVSPAAIRTQTSQPERFSHESKQSPMAEKMQQPSTVSMGKNYEYFSGNTVFCWGGRLQNTRHRPINIVTGGLIVIPAVLFFVFSAPWLWYHVSPALPIICAYLIYICLSSFLHASVTDPGILPRNLHPLPQPDTDDPLAVGPSLNSWETVKSNNPDMAAMDVPTKYCKTCNIWRPLRAHHCRLCDSCIETQDHHCVWLNNCVGRRNYRYFFTFVSSAMITGLFLSMASLGQCIAYSSERSVSFGEAINKNRVPFSMFIYGILVDAYPISLTGYHLFLMARSETTREYLNSHKFLPKDRYRPFDQRSLLSNWFVVLLKAQTPTYLRFKDEYTEGDPRFGPRRGQRQPPLSIEQQGGGMEMQNVSGVPTFQGPSMTRARMAPA